MAKLKETSADFIALPDLRGYRGCADIFGLYYITELNSETS
ncbi:MAG: hypothetical protein OXD49_08290 [Candidatus Poribacteria bacterium]|nr:hypothetical protein [Candidatus Poribacteria bacterium]